MNLIDYNKRYEKVCQKIDNYKNKIESIYSNYDPRPNDDSELNAADQNKLKHYREVIEKAEKDRDIYQERARSQAQSGIVLVSGKKKVIISVVALLTAGALTYGGVTLYKNVKGSIQKGEDKTQEDIDPSKSSDATENNMPYSYGNNVFYNFGQPGFENGFFSGSDVFSSTNTGTVEGKEETEENEEVQVNSLYGSVLNDIDDDDQVYSRAQEIVKLYDKFAPQYGVDVTYVADMLRYINGGVVKETSREAALDVINTFEVLMNNEYLYAAEMRNKGETGRKESNETIDYGIFFIDNTKAQKLAVKISNYRSPIIENPLGDTKEYEQGFTELLMNSWYNNGYEEISAYALESSGMSAIIDKLFLNTADVVRSNPSDTFDVTVHEPLEDKDVTLSAIVADINQANCEVEMTADNGEVFLMYVNKFTYDMEGMLKEAVYNNQAYEENYGKKLK